MFKQNTNYHEPWTNFNMEELLTKNLPKHTSLGKVEMKV